MDSNIANQLMPPAKQQRILIWRDEVASALSSIAPAPSLASSHTSTSLSTSIPEEPDDGLSYPYSPPQAAAPSSPAAAARPRSSLWKRLSSRFRSRTPDRTTARVEGTAMYRNDEQRTGEEEYGIDELVDENSEQGARGLMDKQERLRRAARLLNANARRADATA